MIYACNNIEDYEDLLDTISLFKYYTEEERLKYNEQIFINACYSDNINLVKFLLEVKPDINVGSCKKYISNFTDEIRDFLDVQI